jgi:hypothetical protein
VLIGVVATFAGGLIFSLVLFVVLAFVAQLVISGH